MADSELQQVIQIWKDVGQRAQAITGVEGLRMLVEELALQFPMDADIQSERVDAGGVPAEWIQAPAATNGVLLYLHGGGFVCGSVKSFGHMLGRLARATGLRVLGIEYRLAPENPFPAAVQDAMAAYRWVLSRGVDSKDIVVAGDSAGGGLTLSTLIALRYFGEPLPAAAVCLSPWADLTNSAESFATKAAVDPCVQREALELFVNFYLGNRDRRTPLASPLHADLQGLPPLLIQVGSSETLLDDSIHLADRAKAAGVDVTLEIWNDMVHVWHLFAPILREGRQAIERIGEFVQKRAATRAHRQTP